MPQTSYWTSSGYQVALGSITTPTTKFEDISNTDLTTFEDGGLKTGGATDSNLTALWDLGSDQTVDDFKGAWNRMDTSTHILEYSTAASAGAVWNTASPPLAPSSDPGTTANALESYTVDYGGFSGGSKSARYWRLSVRDQPNNWGVNTRIQLGTFRLFNGGIHYTTVAGGFDSKLSSAFMTFF